VPLDELGSDTAADEDLVLDLLKGGSPMKDYDEDRAVLLLRFTGHEGQIFDRLSASVAELSESDLDKYSQLYEQYDVSILDTAEEALLSTIGAEWAPRNAGEYIDRLARACWRLAAERRP